MAIDDHVLKLFTDRGEFDVPATRLLADGAFETEWQIPVEELNVTEVRFTGKSLKCPVRCILEAYWLHGKERGIWTVLAPAGGGAEAVQLKYRILEQYGEPCRLAFRWSSGENAMEPDFGESGV